jgi:hypothetical protein
LFELPVVVPLTTRLQAGDEVVHVVAALAHSDGVTLGTRLGLEEPDPMTRNRPEQVGRRPPLLEVETVDGRGTFDLFDWGSETDGDLVLDHGRAAGAQGVWVAPLPASGAIRVRLLSGEVAGDWAEVDPAPLRAAAARAVPLWGAYADDPEVDEDVAVLVERALSAGGGSWAAFGWATDDDRPTHPPDAVLGTTLAVQSVVAHDEAHALVIGPLRAYPNGFTVELAALARTPPVRALIHPVVVRTAGEYVTEAPPEMLVLVATDATGRSWTGVGDGFTQSGHRDAHVVSVLLWFAGRPAPGPLTIRSTWPWAGLDGAVEIDGAELLRLAASCEVLLP